MATISPIAATNGEVQVVTWTGITTTTDTPAAYGPLNTGKGAIRAACMMSGTFNGGTTAVLQGSIDGTVWATVIDVNGDAVSATAAKLQEFTSSALYFKPSVGSGSTDNVDCSVLFRN